MPPVASPTPRDIARRLLPDDGRTFATEAGITLRDEPGPLWQLLVLTQLLSARISANVALASARELWRCGWTTPAALRQSTWNARVAALGRGGYRRYDFSTATRLQANAELVQERLRDDLRRLRDGADGDAGRIAHALREFDGIGPVGAAIFLREVQAVWPSVLPYVDPLVVKGAERVGLPSDAHELASLVEPDEFASLAAALASAARSRTADATTAARG